MFYFVFLALSLAASGGYVPIIKLLLSYGAEINSRFVFVFIYSCSKSPIDL